MGAVLCHFHGTCPQAGPTSRQRAASLYVHYHQGSPGVWRPCLENYEAFHEKAAATGNRKWSAIDTRIYNRIFTGHVKKFQIAPSSSSHNTITTPARSLPAITPMPKGSYADSPPTKCPALLPSAPARSNICYLFNRGSCHYGNVCKFRHMRSVYSGSDPKIACKRGKPTPGPKDHGIAKPWRHTDH